MKPQTNIKPRDLKNPYIRATKKYRRNKLQKRLPHNQFFQDDRII